MLLRRFFLLSGTLIILMFFYNLPASAYVSTTTTRPDIFSSVQKEQQPLDVVRCPDVPTLANPLLDFCSPKMNGNTAGPYSAHITMATENVDTNPDAWVLVVGDNSANIPTDSLTLKTCMQKKICFSIPTPKSLGSEQGKTVYSFMWSGPNFPQQPGDYMVAALLKTTGRVIATPNAFTLLTAKVPCITVGSDASTPATCKRSLQRFSLRLTNASPATLTIAGSNWLLGWDKVSFDAKSEKVDISASCLPSQQCTPNTLFTASSPVDVNGTFTISQTIPVNTRGTYILTATNHVPSVIDNNQSDYITDPKSKNSVADATLTFGTPTDVVGLRINVSFPAPPVPTQIPGVRTTPASTLHNIKSNSEGLDWYPFEAAIPAFFGLIIFLFFFIYQRYAAIQAVRTRLSPLHRSVSNVPLASAPSIQPTFQQGANKGMSIPANSTIITSHEFPVLPFPFAITTSNASSSKRIDAKKEIQSAIKKWQNKGELNQAIDTASRLLSHDFNAFEELYAELYNVALSRKLSEQVIQTLEKQAYAALQSVQRPDTNLLRLYSRALVQYTILLARMPEQAIVDKAVIYYYIGYAYCRLVSVTSLTQFKLLEAAKNSYILAWNTVRNSNTESETMNNFLIAIQVSCGDVNIAMAQILQKGSRETRERLIEAKNHYNQASEYRSTIQQQQEIQVRLDDATQRLLSLGT